MLFKRQNKSDYTILENATAPQYRADEETQDPTPHENGQGYRNGAATEGGQARRAPFPQRAQTDFAGIQNDLLPLRTNQGDPILSFPESTIDSLRYMVTRLLVNKELPKRLAIVSALREEGVTYNALALATLLAYDTNQRICYLDLNWWHSFLQQRLPRQHRGIAALLQKQATWDDVLVSTNYANLSLLSAGMLAPQERAATARGTELVAAVDELATYFDQIILDVPAILTTSDAIPLAALADAGCVVVRHGVSTKSLTNRALQDIQHLPMIGVILNRATTQIPDALLKWIPQE